MSSPELDDALLQNAAAGITVNVVHFLRVGANKNARDSSGNTALMLAVRNCHYDTVEKLLEATVDTTITDRDGETALLAAIRSGDAIMVRFLLVGGVDANLANSRTGETPLRAAASLPRRHFGDARQIVRELIKYGADQKETTEDGRRFTDVALEAGNEDLVDEYTKLRPRVVVPPLQF